MGAAETRAEGSSIIIARRGASGYLPEHTLEATVLAHGLGADYIEQDVVFSKDDVPIVLHDIDLDTTTDVASRFPRRRSILPIDFPVAELVRAALALARELERR